MRIARFIACFLLLGTVLAPSGVGAAPPPPASAPADGSVPGAPSGCATTFSGNLLRTLNVNIPDAGIITDTVAVSGLGPSVWDVNVSVTISHSRNSHLAIYLISPHGTRVALSTNNGGTLVNGFKGTTFDDQAGLTHPPGPVTLATFPASSPIGLVMPEQPLARFNGENPNGNWKLEVRDTVPFFTGVLQNWSLAVTALTEAPGQLRSISSISSNNPIPDNGVLQMGVFVDPPPAPLSGITLTTHIQHARVSDLVVSLITPGGITLTVSANRGGANSNIFSGTTWIDAAALGPVTDYAPTSGVPAANLAPQEAFAEMNGLDVGGPWIFRVADTVAGITGTLTNFSIQTVGQTCLPDLAVGINQTPFYTRLGTTQTLRPSARDSAAAAHNVALNVDVSSGFAFQSAAGAGWACPGPAAGTLNPHVACTRSSLNPGSTATVTVQLTAPLAPAAGPYTPTVSSNKPDLDPSNNTFHPLATVFAISANGNPWDVADARTTAWSAQRLTPLDSGGISDGGQSAFSGWGQLRLRVIDFLVGVKGEGDIANLGLTYSPGGHWRTTTPQSVAGIAVSRSLYAPPNADWLRYADTFTNNTDGILIVLVGWGGKLVNSSFLSVSASSNGDQTLTQADTWAEVIARSTPASKAMVPPLGFALRSAGDSSYLGPFISTLTPITTTVWPSTTNPALNHVYVIFLPAHASRTLAYFVVRGLAEGSLGPPDCQTYGGCVFPAIASQVGLIQSQVAALAAHPPLCDLPAVQRNTLVNWPGATASCRDVFLPLVRR